MVYWRKFLVKLSTGPSFSEMFLWPRDVRVSVTNRVLNMIQFGFFSRFLNWDKVHPTTNLVFGTMTLRKRRPGCPKTSSALLDVLEEFERLHLDQINSKNSR